MFSMDEPTDVVGDGYGSKTNKILMKYRVSNYINNVAIYPSTDAIKALMPQSASINVEAYHFYDQFSIIDTKTGALVITEDISPK